MILQQLQFIQQVEKMSIIIFIGYFLNYSLILRDAQQTHIGEFLKGNLRLFNFKEKIYTK